MDLIVLAVVALGVCVGQALVATGAVRAKNAASAGLRALLNLSAAAIGFWALGAAILFSGENLLGLKLGLLVGWSSSYSIETLAYLVLAVIAAGTLNGALGERTPLSVPAWASAVVAAILMPLAGLWVWHGWLKSLGFIDAGGATVLHLTGGLVAAVGVIMAGPRTGKYNRDGSSNVIPGFNIPWVLIGATLIAVCWIALVTLAWQRAGTSAAINVILAVAASVLACVTYSRLRHGKIDVLLTWSALFGGLVAISAPAGMVPGLVAVLIGAVAGLIVPWLTVYLDLRWRFDDPAGMVVPSIFGALWGALVTGAIYYPVIDSHPTLWTRLLQVGVQSIGILSIALLSIGVALILFTLLKVTVGLRVKSSDEYDGLDLAEHDINAHPDFQQTMIKSYHLREA
jgi:ammonium transporter, Amt family